MSDETRVYTEWVPYRLTLRPATAPAGVSWRQLDEYARHLRMLNLPDPTKASARRVAAEHCRDEAERSVSAPVGRDGTITARLADGSLSAKKAAAQFASMPDAKEAEAIATKVRNEMTEQMYGLLRLAALSIHEHPWLGALRGVAAEAIKQRDQAKWDACHAFAEWLRSERVGVRALSAAMASNVEDCDPWMYAVGDGGRGIYHWRVERAQMGQFVPSTPIVLPGGGWRIAFSVKNTVSLPTVADFAANEKAWGGVGLFTGEEVIAGQARALEAQDREIAALMVEPPRTRRVMVG